jgi:hypothetical protein
MTNTEHLISRLEHMKSIHPVEADEFTEMQEIIKRDAEIVRCGECKYLNPPVVSRDVCICSLFDRIAHSKGYCSYGKRKEDKHETD